MHTQSSQIAVDQLRPIRGLLARVVGELTDEHLFRVPDGFSNHVAWNAAHVVVTQQLLHYRLSGLETSLEEELIDSLRKGTSAVGWNHSARVVARPARAAVVHPWGGPSG